MIIDFHTHIFPDAVAEKTIPFLEKRSGICAATDGTLTGLLSSMKKTGVDLSVVLPVVTKPSQFTSILKFAEMVNEKDKRKVISFGGIHPDSTDYKAELDAIKAAGLCGVKIHPDYQGVMIDDVRYMNIIEYADELDLIIIAHAGIDIGLPEPVHCPPEKARKVLDQLNPKKLVLAHYGGWKQWEEVYEYLAGENVYFDTAFTFDYIEQEIFLKIWEKHDKEKILFATDSPWSNPKKGIEAVRNLPLSPKEIEDILGNNAKKLLKLE